MDNKIIAVIIALIIIAVAAFFLLGGSGEDVTIGYMPSDHNAALFIANSQGKFQENGIKTKLVQFYNEGDLMAAMASGDVDIGYVGIMPVLSSIENGVPVKVISAAQNEGSAVVVAKGVGNNSVSDLVGKRIATPGESSIQHMLLAYGLKKNGKSIKDLKVTVMKVPSMNDALRTGKIEGMITCEPYVSIAKKNGARVLVDSHNILPDHPCCVVAASDKFINEHPNETAKILEIHKNATDFINNNTNESVKLLPNDLLGDVKSEKMSMSSFPFISGLNDTYKKDVMDFMKLEVDLGLLKKPISENQIFWQGS